MLRDGRSEIMLYVGHWLVRHPDGTLEPMTDEQMQARFDPVPQCAARIVYAMYGQNRASPAR